MRGRRRRVRTVFFYGDRNSRWVFVGGFILCNHVRFGEASTDGWMDDGRMLCRKMGWGSAIRRSRCSPSRPLDEIVSPSPLCDGVRCDHSGASGSRRRRGASGCYAETPARLVGHWRRAEVLMHAKECVALSVTNRPRCHNSPPSVSFSPLFPPHPTAWAASASWWWRCVALPVRIPS